MKKSKLILSAICGCAVIAFSGCQKDGDAKNFEKIYIGGLKQFLYGHEGNELCY